MGIFNKLSKFIFDEDEEEVKVAKKIDLEDTRSEDTKFINEDMVSDETEEIDILLEEEPEIKVEENFDDYEGDIIEEKFKPEYKVPPYNYQQVESYRSSRETKKFTPSPIISPIYGIKKVDDENRYRKDEVILSAAPVKKTSVDEVRRKAYRYLEKEEKRNVVDLEEVSKINVSGVTVGDAEDYYNELGLEYNVDYKDEAPEEAMELPKEDLVKFSEEESYEEVTKDLTEDLSEDLSKVDIDLEEDKYDDEDDLFDLIESMYVED